MIFGLLVYAQPEADYKKVLTERSAKIVNTLGLNDSNKYDNVVDELVNQYINLNTIHDQNKKAITEIKAKALAGNEMQEAIKKQEENKSSQLKQLHNSFITLLKKNLTDEQLEKVKDGMTYRVFPITYAAYQDMLPALTAEQKEKIFNWLKEARELAMDEGSSDDKHKVFGKYKGRINNYLSAAGYDMKKEGEDWQKRIKESEAQKKTLPINQ
jgi:Spy/CpxP family protein refolding chaperone